MFDIHKAVIKLQIRYKSNEAKKKEKKHVQIINDLIAIINANTS